MKIHGIGTDIIKIQRIQKSIKRKIFLKRIFNKDEIHKCFNTKNTVLLT